MEDEECDYKIRPASHDRWSVLSLAFGLVSGCASVVSDVFESAGIMAIQHSMQNEYNNKFDKIMEKS